MNEVLLTLVLAASADPARVPAVEQPIAVACEIAADDGGPCNPKFSVGLQLRTPTLAIGGHFGFRGPVITPFSIQAPAGVVFGVSNHDLEAFFARRETAARRLSLDDGRPEETEASAQAGAPR